MNKRKHITREFLEDVGITDIRYDEKENEWIITRNWRINRSLSKVERRMTISKVRNKTKYSPARYYKALNLKYENKKTTIALERVIYAWFKGPVSVDYDVDHIDNNPFNNRLENLRLLTHRENMERRYLKINQYYYIKRGNCND